jgi:hypothetical protein
MSAGISQDTYDCDTVRVFRGDESRYVVLVSIGVGHTIEVMMPLVTVTVFKSTVVNVPVAPLVAEIEGAVRRPASLIVTKEF